jgi:hypothetical protein
LRYLHRHVSRCGLISIDLLVLFVILRSASPVSSARPHRKHSCGGVRFNLLVLALLAFSLQCLAHQGSHSHFLSTPLC